MNNKIDCEIIKDLLPSYVDGLTSSVTNEAVEKHISSCESCKEYLDRIKSSGEEEIKFQKKEVDYLKRIKNKNKKNILFAIGIVILAVLIAFFIKFYIVTDSLNDDLNSRVEVKDRNVSLSVSCLDEKIGIKDIDIKEDNGIIKIDVKGALVSPWNKEEKAVEYKATQDIKQILIGDNIIWDNGTYIDEYTSKVYQTKHLYIGDMPANVKTIKALGIDNILDILDYELLTTEEPYTMVINLKKNISEKQKQKFETELKGYGSILIALINNLSNVTFTYDVQNTKNKFTISKEDASEYAKMDIKECGDSAEAIQKILKNIDN